MTTNRVEYSRQWHERNAARVHGYQRDRRAVGRALIHELKSAPCHDCGVAYPPYVMHFDHRDPATKLFEIGNSLARSIEALKAEIAKCDVVCGNCHAERTFGGSRPVRGGRRGKLKSAVSLGRKGGTKAAGAGARKLFSGMTAEERSAFGRRLALARWSRRAS